MGRNNVLSLTPFDYLPCGTGSSLAFIGSKEAIFNHLVKDKLGRTLNMFEYEGFPETFDTKILEVYLQTQGYAIVTNVPDKGIYVLNGTLGGELDASYQPTIAIPVSPYLDFSETRTIGKDCAVIKADNLYRGFSDINSLWGGLLTEAYTTLRVQLINARIPSIIKVEDDSSKQKAIEFFKNVEEGRLSALVTDETIEDIVEGAKALDYSNKGLNHIKDTMELIQYIIARWNIEQGLNDNYNMKREAINSTEVDSNTAPLMTIVDSQLKSRQEGVDEINRIFGTKGKVKLGEDWRRAYKYVVQAMDNAEKDNEQEDPQKIDKETDKETGGKDDAKND